MCPNGSHESGPGDCVDGRPPPLCPSALLLLPLLRCRRRKKKKKKKKKKKNEKNTGGRKSRDGALHEPLVRVVVRGRLDEREGPLVRAFGAYDALTPARKDALGPPQRPGGPSAAARAPPTPTPTPAAGRSAGGDRWGRANMTRRSPGRARRCCGPYGAPRRGCPPGRARPPALAPR